MNFALVNDSVVFEIPEVLLNAPEQASLADWLLHVASSHDVTEGTARIELSTDLWSTWAALPPRDVSPEEIDLWQRRHELLARISGRDAQQLEIASIGHVGGRDLELACRIDGSLTSLSSPVVTTADGPTLVLPAIFEAAKLASAVRPGIDHAAQLAAVGALARYAARAQELLEEANIRVRIALDEHLASMKFEVIDQAALSWSTSGRGNALYDLTLEVREGDDDVAYKKLPIANLDPAAPIISVSGKEHLLLSEEIASVARVAKKNRNKLRRHVADALADPKKVLPAGFAFDGIDLSRYSPRVSGFETVVRADRPVDIRSSGIAWYEEDDGAPFLRLEIAQSDGAVATLDFASPGDVQDFIEQAAAAPEGATIQADGKDVAPTPALIARMRETLVLHEERVRANAEATQEAPNGANAPVSEESAKKRGAVAAIIKDVDEAAEPSELSAIDDGAVPWTTIASLLQPGIELKPHQREGIAWLWHHYRHDAGGVLLADDMGLGKTLQIATFLALTRASSKDQKRLPSLIVAPVILLENWRRELVKFFRPEVFEALIVLHDRPLRQRVKNGILDVAGFANLDWILTNYDTLARFQQQLLSVDWDTVVLDEAQAIKNPDALRTRAARGLKRRFAICSTGTPVENRLLDLWALYDFLSPGRPFGSRGDFERRYEADVSEGIPGIRSALQLPSRSASLLRRTKADALKSLPPKEEKVLYVPMTEEQVSLERFATRDRRGRVLETLHDLQKIYQHPRLYKRSEKVEHRTFSADELIAESPKLAKVIGLLEEIRTRGEKAIVFTLWTAMQDLLAGVLKAKLGLDSVPIINGETNQRGGAQPRLDEFDRMPGFAVIVLSPLAAGTGLTITSANHVIHYGRWWNPAKEDQATDRAYRIGQTRPVYVHYPVLHHPNDRERGFDVKLHTLVSKKRGMARDFLDPDNQADISANDLKEIGVTT